MVKYDSSRGRPDTAPTKSMYEILLINVSGRDRPGITAAMTDVLGRYDVDVLDFGQGVIHDFLAWGMLVLVPPKVDSNPLYKELVLKAHELELDIQFTPIDEQRYEYWVQSKDRARHTITLLGRVIGASDIARVSEILASYKLNILRITRISGRRSLDTPLDHCRTAIALSVRGDVPDITSVRAQLMHIAYQTELDIAIQAENVYRRYRRLICFDMDSTLIQAEIMDELADIAGKKDEVAAITRHAMRGEINFVDSLHNRLALLEGLDESALERVASSLTLTEGAERLISILKHLGLKIAIISGGFTYFALRLQERLDIDYVYANEFEIQNGKLTGKVKGDVIDGNRKAALLESLAQREGIKLSQVIAVGDGANDIPMLSIAGLGVAFNAKPSVKQRAHHAIGAIGLDGILYLLGMRDRELTEFQY